MNIESERKSERDKERIKNLLKFVLHFFLEISFRFESQKHTKISTKDFFFNLSDRDSIPNYLFKSLCIKASLKLKYFATILYRVKRDSSQVS